jgi:hypothetical protein
VEPEQSTCLDSQIPRFEQVTTFPRKGKTMQARFRIPVTSLLLTFLAFLGRPEKGYAQVTDYNYLSSGTTEDNQQTYVNFALQSSTGMNYATKDGIGPGDTGPSGTTGLKRVMVRLGGISFSEGRASCLEVTTSIATTGYPSTHVWFNNDGVWQSISTGLTNFVRVLADQNTAVTFPLYVFAGSSNTNNKDFNIVVTRMNTANSTRSGCQVAGKPFIDFMQEDANGFYTANTN